MSGILGKRLLPALVLLGIAGGGTALAQTAVDSPDGIPVQSLLHPAGPQAEEVFRAMMFDIYGIIVLFVILAVAILYAIVRFADRSRSNDLPPQITGNRNLEVGWTLALIAGLVIFLVHPVKAEFVFEDVPNDPKAIDVKVTGHQWWWEIEYPQYKIKTANELIIPAGTVVRIKTTSVDVMHSMGVPRLGGKNESMPGRITRFWIKADQPGNFQGQCMQLCGKSHARMYFRVIAKTPEEFDAWVKARTKPAINPTGAAAQGLKLFEQKCAMCHTVDGTKAVGVIGPNLTFMGDRTSIGGGIRENTPQNLAQWIENPQSLKPGAIMPGAQTPGGSGVAPTGLSQADIDSLVAFLEGMKTK